MSEQKAPTGDNIDRAISWYEANVEAITAALPISTPGVMYKAGCSKPLSGYIASWKSGSIPLNLAICYIYRPIQAFYKYLRC